VKWYKQPLGYEHVVIVPDSMESDGQQWVLYGREIKNPNNFVTVTGICWEKTDTLYKLATTIGELP
jgi:hypothetical protein